MIKILLPLVALAGWLATPAQAQVGNSVTEIITDYGGFWRSGTGTSGNAVLNPINPENSHSLLAFKFNGSIYSTGVDNAVLTANNLTFLASEFQALPVLAISGDPTGNTKVALGQLKDGVNNGASSPPPSRELAQYLTDGRRGLDIGTGVANIQAGNVDFDVTSVDVTSIGDKTPDIIISQIAEPGTDDKADSYQFLDSQNRVVGNQVSVVIKNIPSVGNWQADFYEASQNPMTLVGSFANSPRGIRLWAADFGVFGINASNVGQISKFRINFNGNSDPAFVAFNTKAAKIPVLPVTLTSFTGQARATYSELRWETAQELNSAAFEVEASTDGRAFVVVGRVAAAGNSSSTHAYSYRHSTTQAGPRYYRLRQLDLDGSSSYSSVITLTAAAGPAGAVRVTAAPNPFSNTLKLLLDRAGAAPANVQVQLCTLTGRAVYERSFEQVASSGLLELSDLAGLPAGIYLARVLVGGHSTVLKVVKQ